MTTTVYFATNRLVTDSSDPDNGYSTVMVPPLQPDKISYGAATVDGINIDSNNAGAIKQIAEVTTGDFSDAIKAKLSTPGNNILVFVHGYSNSFKDAITRAAFNREWLAASRQSGTDTTIVAFCWPSIGKSIGFPILWSDYKDDQHMARNCGPAMMTFLSRIQPALGAAAKNEAARCSHTAWATSRWKSASKAGSSMETAQAQCSISLFLRPPIADMTPSTRRPRQV